MKIHPSADRLNASRVGMEGGRQRQHSHVERREDLQLRL